MARDRSPSILLALLLVLSATTAVSAEGDPAEIAWLGVKLGGVTTTKEGVPIFRVFLDGPAARAGLRASDRIVAFDGAPVSGVRDLIGQIRNVEPGSWIPLTVSRKGKQIELRARLGSRPSELRELKVRHGWIGLRAIELPPELREHFGAPADAGVMISQVAGASPAEAAGFELGDVVYEVDGRPIGSARALQQLVAGGGVGNDAEFSVVRNGADLVLEARIETVPPRPETR